MNHIKRYHPAEQMGLWIPKGGTTAEEQEAYVKSDKGVLGDVLPLEVTQEDIDNGGCLHIDHAVSLAFSRALGYEVATSDGYLYPIGLMGEIEYVDEAMGAGLHWRRNYRCIDPLSRWIEMYCRRKKYGETWRGYETFSPITVDFEGRVNPFGIWYLSISKGWVPPTDKEV